MTVPLPSGRARVETIAPPSGRPFLHAAAGDGWVLAVDGGGVVVWSEKTGYRQEPEHPPFVTRVDACPGGFVLFADDGGRYYAGFYSTAERRFTWWQPASSEWPELEGRSGRASLFEDLVLLPAVGRPGHWVVLRAASSGLERVVQVDAGACGPPTVFWRNPSSGEIFLGSGRAVLRISTADGGGKTPPTREPRRLDLSSASLTCGDGTVLLRPVLGLASGYSLVTRKFTDLPQAITLAREPWDAFLAGDRVRVRRFVSLLAALEKGNEADPLLAVTFTAAGSPLAVLDRGIHRVPDPCGDPPRATRPLFPADALASWLYLGGIDGGLEAALDALTRASAPHGLVDALESREGRAAFAQLVRFARDRDPYHEPPGRGVSLLVERLGGRVSAEVVEALNDPDPGVAAIGCAALRSRCVDVGGELNAPSGKVYRRLANLLSSPAPGAARAALATLRERKLPISPRRIRALLCHEEPEVRQDACALVCQGGPSPLAPFAHDALARLLRSETDPWLRSVLTRDLAREGKAPRLVTLAAADVSSLVREQAFPGFGKLVDPSEPGLCLSALDAVFLSAVTESLRSRRSRSVASGASGASVAIAGVAKLDRRLGCCPELFEEFPVALLAVQLVAFAGRVVFGAGPEPWALAEIERAASLLSREPGLGGLSAHDLAWLEASDPSAAVLARFSEKVAPWPTVGARIDALAVVLSALEEVRGGLANAAPKGSLTARLREAGVDRAVRAARERLPGGSPEPSARALGLAARAFAGEATARAPLCVLLCSKEGIDLPVAIPTLLELAPDPQAAAADLAAVLLSSAVPIARRWQTTCDLGKESRVRLDDLDADVRRALATEVVLASVLPFPQRRVAGQLLDFLGDPDPLGALWAERASRTHGLTALDRWRRDLDGCGEASATPGGPPAAH